MDHRVAIRSTPDMGRGVFATAMLKAGDCLNESFYTLQIPADELAIMEGTAVSRYWFEDDGDGSAYLIFGYAELINHGDHPNIECA